MEGFDELAGRVAGFIRGVPEDDREAAIAAVRDVLDRELFDCCRDPQEPACPSCACRECVRNGRTRAGTQRYLCSGCGRTYCRRETGGILRNTKLPREKWMRYAECFVDGLASPKAAERLDVTTKTAWFMRIRTLEALFRNLPSFEVKSGCGCEVDEMYLPESFKGVSLRRWGGAMPREPRRGRGSVPRGISGEQICVVTGVNDGGDMFFEVACRGAMTCEVAGSVLRRRILEGAVVNTDRHRSYGRVLSELGAAFHVRHAAGDHEGLERVDALHSQIRGFLRRFNGVSTKWLHLYLAWFKWLREFGRPGTDGRRVAAGQIASGDYDHTYASIREMGLPFRDASLEAVKVRSLPSLSSAASLRRIPALSPALRRRRRPEGVLPRRFSRLRNPASPESGPPSCQSSPD